VSFRSEFPVTYLRRGFATSVNLRPVYTASRHGDFQMNRHGRVRLKNPRPFPVNYPGLHYRGGRLPTGRVFPAGPLQGRPFDLGGLLRTPLFVSTPERLQPASQARLQTCGGAGTRDAVALAPPASIRNGFDSLDQQPIRCAGATEHLASNNSNRNGRLPRATNWIGVAGALDPNLNARTWFSGHVSIRKPPPRGSRNSRGGFGALLRKGVPIYSGGLGTWARQTTSRSASDLGLPSSGVQH